VIEPPEPDPNQGSAAAVQHAGGAAKADRIDIAGEIANSTRSMFALADLVRRAQAEALGSFGLAPTECSYRTLASGRRYRIRAYTERDGGPRVLIVSAPIKRPYIWDLAPAVSVVRQCLRRRVELYLLEWIPPEHGDGCAGLDEYADEAISEAVAVITDRAGDSKPVLMGHSLGGTFAAIFAALEPQRLRGLVLLGAPLCFHPGVSRLRDGFAAIASSFGPEVDLVLGSLISQVSAAAAPDTFIWSRLIDTAFSFTDPQGLDVCARVERWALDEVALPGKLVAEILQWLYRDDRFFRGTLPMRNRTVGPSCLAVPVLAVINAADEIASHETVAPFLGAMPAGHAHLIEHPGESGVGLQHLAILIGRRAHAHVWPQIMSWLEQHR
jgi:polyhydroxyalkanoate synthase